MTYPGRIMARLALIVGASLVTFGYSKCVFVSNTGGTGFVAGSSSGGGSSSGTGNGTGFNTTLVLRDTSGNVSNSFLMGQSIRFDLAIENQSGLSTTLQFADAQIYDFYVLDAGTRQVRWRWSDGMSFAQVATQLAFPAYSSKSYSIVWNGVLSNGTQLPAGNYQARGVIVADDFTGDPLIASNLGSNVVSFTVH